MKKREGSAYDFGYWIPAFAGMTGRGAGNDGLGGGNDGGIFKKTKRN